MLTIVQARELRALPHLRDLMFRHRAVQFGQRLGWNVHVDRFGREIDEYDSVDASYLIATDKAGGHLGSMRLLPTTKDTMINDHFSGLMGGVKIKSPDIWESTRFCIAPKAPGYVASQLLIGAHRLALKAGIYFFVGVFEYHMRRIYQRLGWSPEILATASLGGVATSIGVWEVKERNLARMLKQMPLPNEACSAFDNDRWVTAHFDLSTCRTSSRCPLPASP